MTDEKKGTGVVEVKNSSLLAKFGTKYSVDARKVYETLCATAFSAAKTEEQVIALLVVADQYGLNPFTKEIFAFPGQRGEVVPVVGIDGWNRIAQQHPQFDGVELRYSENMVEPPKGKSCPEWVEAVIYRKDRQHPVVIREFIDECFRSTGPWESHTKRMLRHKALIQGYRTAFGFHGIYDQDEAERIIDVDSYVATPPEEGRQTRQGTEAIGEALGKQEAVEPAPANEEEQKPGVVDPEQSDDGIDI
jgi:phage recombination protein Bet